MKVAQLCLTLCNPTNYTVRGILQARILEWVAFPFSRGIFPTQGSNPSFLHCRQMLYQLSHRGSPRILEKVAYIPFPVDLPDPGIELGSPALQLDSLPTELSRKPIRHSDPLDLSLSPCRTTILSLFLSPRVLLELQP